MPENNIRSVKQNPFTPPATSPTELTTYIGTPPTNSPTELTNYIGTPPWAMVQARRAPLLPMPRPTPRR
ncbi:hypothetical protein CKF53_02470 [Corynebacterium striatum]|nr:hypothetical protein CKF53_02470 [Corynebacterium striatum]